MITKQVSQEKAPKFKAGDTVRVVNYSYVPKQGCCKVFIPIGAKTKVVRATRGQNYSGHCYWLEGDVRWVYQENELKLAK